MTQRWSSFVFKIALSGLLLWVLVSQIDLFSIWNQAKTINPGWLSLATLLMVLQVLISSLRWGAVLGAIGAVLSFRSLVQITFLSLFFNLALPASVGGDAVRVWKSVQRGLLLPTAINGVLLERVVSVLGAVLLLLITHPILQARVKYGSVLWMITGGLGIVLGGLLLLMLIDRLPASWQRWKLVRGTFRLAQDTRCLFLRPRESSIVLGLSVGGQLNLAVMTYILALGLRIPLGLLDTVLLMPLVSLVSSLPISVSGWGVREGVMVVAFGLVGVPASSALLLSILLGLVSTIVSLGGGIVWWLDNEQPGNVSGASSQVPPVSRQ